MDEDLQQNFWILSEGIVGKPTEPLSDDNQIETVSRASTASSEEVQEEEIIAEKLESSSSSDDDDEKDQEIKVDENIPMEEPHVEICEREIFEDQNAEEDISMNRTYETQETRIITDDQDIESP